LKFLVVGAGGQGAPCASVLSRDTDCSGVVLVDINSELLEEVSKKIASEKVTTMRVDAGKLDELLRAAEGVDAVINLTHIRFNSNIMEAAWRSGAHYVDTALDYEGIWSQLVGDEPLEFDEEFKKEGLTAVIGCGGSPGVTNVLTRYVCDKLDRVESIRIVLGGRSLKKTEDVIETWEPGWSPEIAFEDYSSEADVFEDGKYRKVPPFDGVEEYKFPEPVGPLLVSWHCHEEPVMLPRFIGKGVKYVDFRYPINRVVGALIKLGFARDEPVEVRGVKALPRDVLMRLVRRPVNDFLTEDESTITAPSNYAGFNVIEVEGEKAGDKMKYTVTRGPTRHTTNERLEMFRRWGTTGVGVAVPAIVATKMSLEGDAERGVIAPECLDPIKFLGKMAEMGVPTRFQETLSKSVSFS
jgi:saccharopine dehydrogenase (NAD+, L-lysine-forming)